VLGFRRFEDCLYNRTKLLNNNLFEDENK